MSVPKPNFSRMMRLIDDVFATRHDPGQLQVTPTQQKKLAKIHPSTLVEYSDENGPLIWILMIPTTFKVMDDFIHEKITETELLEQTHPGDEYECIYLCSATTLEEMRRKGKTKELALKAIREISRQYPVKTLFVWPFTSEGDKLAASLARETGLSLMKRGRK